MAGAALWLWGLLAPKVRGQSSETGIAPAVASAQRFDTLEPEPSQPAGSSTAFDRQMLYKQIRERLSPDDLLDVIFDLGWSENEVIAFGQDNNQLINAIIDKAEREGQTGELALAVERVLTPIPKESLPRLEKLSEASPPTILRHYLLAYYDLAGLEELSTQVGIDWELIGGDNKKTKTRNLLLYTKRRGRLPDAPGR